MVRKIDRYIDRQIGIEIDRNRDRQNQRERVIEIGKYRQSIYHRFNFNG